MWWGGGKGRIYGQEVREESREWNEMKPRQASEKFDRTSHKLKIIGNHQAILSVPGCKCLRHSGVEATVRKPNHPSHAHTHTQAPPSPSLCILVFLCFYLLSPSLSLTLSFASMLAPAASSASTHSTLFLAAANRSAVKPPFQTKRKREEKEGERVGGLLEKETGSSRRGGDGPGRIGMEKRNGKRFFWAE